MDKDTKKWFFNLDERIDRIDTFYNSLIYQQNLRIEKLENKVDELEAQERAITKVINMNAEDIAKLINKMESK